MPTRTIRDQIRFDHGKNNLPADILVAWLAGLPGDATISPFTELRETGMHDEVVPAGLTATYHERPAPDLTRTPPSPDTEETP